MPILFCPRESSHGETRVALKPEPAMPIANVVLARTVIVMKRSMKAGFAGVDNPLFIASNARMLFGDAKQTLQAIVGEFKES